MLLYNRRVIDKYIHMIIESQLAAFHLHECQGQALAKYSFNGGVLHWGNVDNCQGDVNYYCTSL